MKLILYQVLKQARTYAQTGSDVKSIYTPIFHFPAFTSVISPSPIFPSSISPSLQFSPHLLGCLWDLMLLKRFLLLLFANILASLCSSIIACRESFLAASDAAFSSPKKFWTRKFARWWPFFNEGKNRLTTIFRSANFYCAIINFCLSR